MYEQIIHVVGILVLCSGLPWGIWCLVWSSHSLDLVVQNYAVSEIFIKLLDSVFNIHWESQSP
jgi:hypothetical protein